MTTPNELAFHERIHDLRFRPFAQVGLTKVSSPQNQTYPTCFASLKTNFWHTSDITNLQELIDNVTCVAQEMALLLVMSDADQVCRDGMVHIEPGFAAIITRSI